MHEVNLASSSPQQFPRLITKNHPEKKKNTQIRTLFLPRLAQLGGIFFWKVKLLVREPLMKSIKASVSPFGIQTASATPGC